MTTDTVEQLTVRLKSEFHHYVILHAKTSPERVATFFLDESIGADEDTVRHLSAVLRSGHFWKASQVAEVLIEAYAALQQGQEPGFCEPDLSEADKRVLEQASEIVEGSDSIPLDPVEEWEEPNPFAGLDPEQTFGAKDAAGLMGRSYGYMKDHGNDFGGTKTTRGAWQFTAAALAAAWPDHKG